MWYLVRVETDIEHNGNTSRNGDHMNPESLLDIAPLQLKDRYRQAAKWRFRHRNPDRTHG